MQKLGLTINQLCGSLEFHKAKIQSSPDFSKSLQNKRLQMFIPMLWENILEEIRSQPCPFQEIILLLLAQQLKVLKTFIIEKRKNFTRVFNMQSLLLAPFYGYGGFND